MNQITLRDVQDSDLPIIFAQHQSEAALYMAAFTPPDPADLDAFSAHWQKIRSDKTVTLQTILVNGVVAGYISQFEMFDEPEIGYWLGEEFWGKGVATEALTQFLLMITIRPLYARTAKDNIASIRVLQKCGFTITGDDKGFAYGRNAEIEEYILTLK